MSRIRMGIIGAGHWAVDNHIPVLKSFEDVEVVAVCRVGTEQLSRLQQSFDIPFGTENYKELLALENLDGVVVSSPHHLHYEHASAALTSGRHVLCEKPMALSSSEAKRLVTLVESKKLHFVIPYGWSFTDYASEARKRMLEDGIGRIQHVFCHMSSALRDLFNGDGAWFAKESFFVPDMETWSDPNKGGGYAYGQLTHALGLLFWIANLEPVEVFAFLGPSRTGVDISNAITCRFSNGATGMLGGAGLNPPGCPDQVDIRLFGSEGMMLLDIERPRLEIRRYDGRDFSMTMNHEPGGYSCVAPLRTLVDLMSGKNVENPASAQLGSRVVEMLDAAFRSARSKKVESVGQ